MSEALVQPLVSWDHKGDMFLQTPGYLIGEGDKLSAVCALPELNDQSPFFLFNFDSEGIREG